MAFKGGWPFKNVQKHLHRSNSTSEHYECLFAVPQLSILHSLYLLLQLKNAIQQCLCRRRTARHVYVNRYDTITSTNNRVRVVIISTTIGTASHWYDPLRVKSLVINSAQCWCHLVGHRASDYNAVGLTRAGTKHHPKSVHVIPETNPLSSSDNYVYAKKTVCQAQAILQMTSA